jgi:hypothetical protein
MKLPCKKEANCGDATVICTIKPIPDLIQECFRDILSVREISSADCVTEERFPLLNQN